MNQKPFQQAEREFFLLKGQFAANRITRAQFDAALEKLNVRDEFGRAWRMDADNGAWLVKAQDAWVPANPATYPPPAVNTEKLAQTSDTAARSRNLILFSVLGVLALLCLCLVGVGTVLFVRGLPPLPLGLAATATSTNVALLSTATPTLATQTPAETEAPLATFEPTDNLRATPTPRETSALTTPLPTPNLPPMYTAFDADFFADECPLFQGDNETRQYGCDFGEYFMLNKQATTRYTYYDTVYTDAVIEANGYLTKGAGKYEYGIVFRANTDGTAYYVFTVTNDGKYNVSIYKNDAYTDLIPYTESSAVHVNGDNFFQVVLRGSEFDFYLNGEYLNHASDASYASGVAGLFFYNAEPNAEVSFDQFTISTFTPPTPTASPAANTTPVADATSAANATPTLVQDTHREFVDDFAGACALFEGANETRDYKCENGEYTMLHKTNVSRWSVYADEYSDGIYEADGHFISGSGNYEYGLVVRAQDNPWKFYGFTVTGSGKYSVFLFANDNYVDLIPYTASPLVKTGTAVNHFRILAQGSQLNFYLNGEAVGTITDTALNQGSPGFFLNNSAANTKVGFDNFHIAPVTQLAATPTPVLVNPTVAVKPGLYVSSLRFTPRTPKRGDPLTFFVTFVNTTGKPQNYKWLVEIWEQDTNKKNPYGQADAAERNIPVGTNERGTGSSFKVAGGGPCVPLRARVVFENDQGVRVPFKRTNGSDLWVNFQVCP